MRRILQHEVAFAHSLAHETELAVFKITNPAVRHVRRSGRRARTKIAALDEQDIHAVDGEIAERANAVDASADDEDGGVWIFFEGGEGFGTIHLILNTKDTKYTKFLIQHKESFVTFVSFVLKIIPSN